MESPVTTNVALPKPDYISDLKRFSRQKAISLLIEDYICFESCIKPDSINFYRDYVFSIDKTKPHGFEITYSGTVNGALTVKFKPLSSTEVANLWIAENI